MTSIPTYHRTVTSTTEQQLTTERHYHQTNTATLIVSQSTSLWPTQLGLSVRKFPAENFRKFIPTFPEISGNVLITYVNQLFPSPALQSDAVK